MAEIKEDILQNFVDLQDVLSNLALKIDDLTQQVSKLLRLFEESAKSFQEASPEPSRDREFHSSIKTLLDQNKIIAKGISIIEERLRSPQPQNTYIPYQQPPPLYPPQPIRYNTQNQRNPSSQQMTPSITLPKTSESNPDIKTKPKPLPTENE